MRGSGQDVAYPVAYSFTSLHGDTDREVVESVEAAREDLEFDCDLRGVQASREVEGLVDEGIELPTAG